MFCWKCGKEVSPDSKFCEYCGNALNHSQLENATDIPLQKGNGKKVITSVIATALVVAIGVGGFFGIRNFLGDSREDESSANVDSQGIYLISQKTISYYSDEDSSEETVIKYDVEYDEQGNQLSVSNVTVNDGVETNNWTNSYSYDNNGDLIASSSDISGTRTEYTNDSNGLEVSSVSYGNDGELAYQFEKKYDDGNHLLNDVRYRDDGSIQARWDYEYDTKGNLIEEQWMSFAGDGSVQPTYYIDDYQDIRYVYSEDNSLVSRISRNYIVGSTGSYSINNGGSLEMGEYSETKTDYIYDDGNLIEEQTYYDGVLNNRCVHQYADNRLQKTINYFNEDRMTTISYTYDDNGNCISQELYDSEDRVIMRSEYVYVYREVSRRHMQRVNEGQEFLKSTNI